MTITTIRAEHTCDYFYTNQAMSMHLISCVTLLEKALDKLKRECGGLREYKGGSPSQFLFPAMEEEIREARKFLGLE